MKIEFIPDQEYSNKLILLLGKAKKSIDLMSYSFAIGSSSGRLNQKTSPYLIAQKLIEMKHKLGPKIKIRLFIEGFRDTSQRNQITVDFLKEAGVEVTLGSTHAKGICIDGRFLLFGSTNLTHQSITKNFEANVFLDDKEVCHQFLRYFNYYWKGGKHGGIKLKSPLVADGGFKDQLIRLIQKAKKQIDFSIYFFNHREIEKALIQAHERGVKMRGLIHQHASFALPYIWANRSTVKRMAEAGIEDLHFGPSYLFSHSKYIVVDHKEIMLGTGNWLKEDVLIHPQLYLHLLHPVLAKKLIKHLEHQIENSL